MLPDEIAVNGDFASVWHDVRNFIIFKFLRKQGFSIMASKSKKAVALVLTAMMAASALAGCDTSSTQPSTSSTPSTSTESSTSEGSSDDGSTAEAIDLFSDEMIQQVKDAMASEAKDGKIVLKVWCASDDSKFEKYVIEKFKEMYADSRYEISISLNANIGEDTAAGKVVEDPTVAADVFSFADDQLRTLVNAGAIAQVAETFYNNVKAENTAESVEVCSINGTPYAFPKTADNGYFLYYDKRVLSEEDVQCFDTMIEKANAAGKNVLMNITNSWYTSGFFFTAGCSVSLADDGKTQITDYNSDKGVSAVKAMCHLAEQNGKGFEGSGDDTVVVQGFGNESIGEKGRLCAAVTGTWNGAAIRNAIGAENVGAAKLPTVLMDGEQKQLCSFGGYKIVGVKAGSDYPLSAQAYAYFITSEEMQKLRYSGATNSNGDSISRGFIPTNTAALESDEIKDDPAAAAIDAQRPYSQPQSNVGGTYWTPVQQVGTAVNSANGKMTDAEIQKALEECVNAM